MKLLRWQAVLALACATLFSFTSATANPGGVTGVYQNGCGGFGCHGGAANNATALTLGGPTTLAAGSTGNYSVGVQNAAQVNAGFNAAFTSTQGNPSGTFSNAGNDVRFESSQATHSQEQALAANFTFSWTAPAAHGVYTFRAAANAVNNANGANGDIWNVANVQVTVTGATLTQPAGGAGYCVGNTLPIRWTQTGIPLIKIDLSSDNFANVTSVATNADGPAGQLDWNIPANQAASTLYQIRLIDPRNGNVLATSNNFSISGAPTIQTQPQSQAACAGRGVTFTTGAAGSNLVYRWRKNGADIPGATTGILTLNNLKIDDAGTYDCVITSCNQNATTQGAVLTVNLPPSVTMQPNPQSVCEGQAASFSVDATGSELTFQWLKDGVPIAGATNKEYRIPATDIGDAGKYRCRITGACTPQVNSNEVDLVVDIPPAITNHPKAADLKVGQQLMLIVAHSGANATYQWKKGGVDVAGATNDTLVIQSVALADSGRYTVVVKNPCGEVQSNAAQVKVTPQAGPGVFALSTDAVRFTDLAVCATKDTILTGLVQNTGGTEISVNSATADPTSMITVVGFAAPIVLAPGQAAPVTIRVNASEIGTKSGTVQFVSSVGTQTLTVTVVGTPVLNLNADTLKFAEGQVDQSRCASTVAINCGNTVTGLRLRGDGASTYEISPNVAIPVAVDANNTLEVCVKSIAATGAPAQLVITTTAGEDVVELVREVVSSVEEQETVIAGLHVAPNPMTDELRITSDSDALMTVRVYTITANVVAQFSGNGELRWDRRDLSGSLLPAGLYVLSIEQRGQTDVVKIIVQ